MRSNRTYIGWIGLKLIESDAECHFAALKGLTCFLSFAINSSEECWSSELELVSWAAEAEVAVLVFLDFFLGGCWGPSSSIIFVLKAGVAFTGPQFMYIQSELARTETRTHESDLMRSNRTYIGWIGLKLIESDAECHFAALKGLHYVYTYWLQDNGSDHCRQG